MKGEDVFDIIVPSYFEVDNYEIVVLQDPEGNLLTLKIEEYEG
tara:strand:- start:158 stop:286 length:129 start_codon:yes stop_codon:yes gene_type:complete